MTDKYKIIALGKMVGGSMEPEEKELSGLDAEIEIVEARCATEDELIEAAADADVILGGNGRMFTRKVMESLPKCKAIFTYSVGFDTLDIEAATENGILIVNNAARGWCAEEVSNHAIALLLNCAKKLMLFNDLTRQGRWAEARDAQAPMGSIHGQTLGLVGCGELGRMTARKAQVFGLRTIGYDPYLEKSLANEYNITLMSLEEVLREADYVSIHTPLNDQTRHLMGEKEFSLMKPSAYLINTARGPIIDEKAMIKALEEKRIAGAGLDVFETEPVEPDNPLLKMDNVITIPHTASYSDAAVKTAPASVGKQAAALLSGRWPRNIINKDVKPKIPLKKGD